jgi:hypothetical protein
MKHLLPLPPPNTTLSRLPRCSNGGTQLAILHPRKLAVYSCTSTGQGYLALSKLYEHHLDHTAFNMTLGSFGGAHSGEEGRRMVVKREGERMEGR